MFEVYSPYDKFGKRIGLNKLNMSKSQMGRDQVLIVDLREWI